MRRFFRLCTALLIGIGAGTLIATDNALQMPKGTGPPLSAEDDAIAATQVPSGRMSASVRRMARCSMVGCSPRSNGAILRSLRYMVLGDTRLGMLAHAAFLLREGFTVLTPDLRGHGVSGGPITTYGIREARDVHSWTDWLTNNWRYKGSMESGSRWAAPSYWSLSMQSPEFEQSWQTRRLEISRKSLPTGCNKSFVCRGLYLGP